MTIKASNFIPFFEPRRDAYGFTVRPQHLQRYKEYANIYKEEEEERSGKWKRFLDQQAESAQPCSPEEESSNRLHGEVTEQREEPSPQLSGEGDDSSGGKSACDIQTEKEPEKEVQESKQTKTDKVQTWAQIRLSLHSIENMMSFRVKKRKNMKEEHMTAAQNHLPPIDETITSRGESEEDFEEEFYDNEIVDDDTRNAPAEAIAASDGISPEPFFPWKEELEFLVHGGIPRDLRGEVWQAFVGVRTRRVERYYENLLASESDASDTQEHDKSGNGSRGPNGDTVGVPEKLKKQIEKAMNFFAGILLLMMPEENAFWTFVGIIDDYFDGCYSEEMIESQVDQLVFEELMRKRFPKLVNHLDYLGVQVTWISASWFLSVYVNMLPWESVLRIWDVLLFEGNRVMLFRTALALMELYGPALVTTKDAGDAITLLQSLAGSTFDSSQLVLTACMGFLSVTEDRLQDLREKHRPAVIEAVEELSKGQVSKNSKGLATKLYSFKHDPGTQKKDANAEVESGDGDISHLESRSTNLDDFLSGITTETEVDSVPDLQEQVTWLKVELCSMLEDKRSATLRAEELETALMEMVKQDNRRQLSARVEQLEQEVAELRQALSDKKEQENVMLQVLMRVEQEQKVTEDARVFAEQDATAQRYAVQMLEEKYEKAMASLDQMEKRVVMAESMLEATIQYQHGQVKALASPGSVRPDSPTAVPTRRIGLLSFGMGWRDRNKAKETNAEDPKKATNIEDPSQSKSTSEELSSSTKPVDTNGLQEQEK
ncbi:putative GTPase-activating protein AN11010 [Camellia lanceoleosa]|uniref:GTPase-activating protein AN11010 n=1 Tax=Camellia lanceoleosa TaxID=1840588 RepID=A0ACC0HPJ9_9ERIC|nr:putative GTPase-activating protein AN11010 [Camellia lanceoleosa]